MSGPRWNNGVLLLLLFGLSPVGFYFLLMRPSLARMDAHRARVEEISEQLKGISGASPLTQRERQLLGDPEALWRQRIPAVNDDASRLAHYHQVITRIEQVWQKDGVRATGFRSTWDPIRASFTLSSSLETIPESAVTKPPPELGHVQAWVMEVRVDGPPSQLFHALAALPRVEPLLEPVGLRWESGVGSEIHEPRQYLVLRNFVLVP